ncbi:MAG: DMT family transporter [bacterium]|nr:DMT family transporter [bacterium]
MPYLGEVCALVTASMWALSGITFGVATKSVGGFATNHFRIWAALPPLAIMALVSQGTLLPAGMNGERATLLVLSGFVGLVIGDLGYFHALATIGPRLASVVMATWPVMALGLGPLAGESFDGVVLPGVLVTVLGVALVLATGRSSSWNPATTPRQRLTGLIGAVVAALGQAGGVVLARYAMVADADLPAGLDPLGATLVRMAAAVLGLQLVALLRQKPLAGAAVVRRPAAQRGALLGTLFGPVIGVWMSMVASKESANVGVAAALMATAPLFMIPLARWAYGSRISWVGWLGTLLTVAGAALCFPEFLGWLSR